MYRDVFKVVNKILINRTVECQVGIPISDPTVTIITEFSVAIAGLLFLLLLVSVVLSCCIRKDRADAAGNKYQSINQDFS